MTKIGVCGRILPLKPLEVFFYCVDFGETEVVKMAKQSARDKLTLACEECKQRNYQTYKNKKNNSERLELKKYCPFCRKHTVHKETK